MPVNASTFYFRAGTPGGEVFAGELRANSPEEAIQQLRRKGFQPLGLDTRPIRENWLHREVSFGGGRKLNLVQCGSFCRELALLLRSGVPVVEALAVMLAALPPKSRAAGFVSAVRHRVQLGGSLSDAVSGAGYILPSDLAPVLQAGEVSGTVGEALAMLAQSYSEADHFRRAFVSAAAYPALLLFISLFVFGLIALFVAPSLAELFKSMDRPVPLPLALLTGLGEFLTQYGAVLATAVALTTVGVIAGGGAPAFRRGAARMLAAVPGLGSALNWAASRRFVATLKLHLASHISLGAALPGAFASASFPGGDARANTVVARVRAGAALGPELRAARLLPDKLVHLVEVGENGGRLAEVLGVIADEAKARFEQRMALVASLLAPALILAVGTIIGAVIFSVFSALLEINEIAF